ncbi:hypothetical protein CXG81DRAFT_10621 [Caulochytrium protostelioides]|uniref:Amino acid transporter n=1 Tax=Caulochytrium protostelioides TaxID=1555241 RepID=A0A4P9XB10_9FUNG|nr:hypothetical protein CXG81DRAFT_10621 [Caulochytrium protostelioides]|eukprot:RKP02577.1 hypothetical protein CXG81DRAFT_10621 [Caulochytrium protostelioides]
MEAWQRETYARRDSQVKSVHSARESWYDDKHVPVATADFDEEAGAPAAAQMGWFSGMCLVVGLMIGGGIFSTPGKVLSDVGSPGIALLCWAFGGFVAFCGTFCYIELGTAIPKSGGEQAYLCVSYPKPVGLVSFMFCWAMIMCARPGASAADITIFAKYLLLAHSPTSSIWTERIVGLISLTGITVLNMVSLRWAIRIHDGLTVVKMGILALITLSGVAVASGMTSIPQAGNFANTWGGAATSGGAYATALFRVLWSFDGWNNLNYAVGELKDPSKNLPKAAGMGVAIVTGLYLLANVAYLAVVPLDQLISGGELVASNFFIIVFGEFMGQRVLPLFIALAAFGAVCAMVFSAARVVYAAAQAGMLPFSGWLATLNPRFQTPINALLLNYALTVFLLLAPPPGAAFDFLVGMVGYPTWFFYALCIIGLILMRKTHPDLHRPFRVFLPVAFFFVLVAIFLCTFPFYPTPSPDYPYWAPPTMGLLFILSGIPAWHFWGRGMDPDFEFEAGGH